MRILGETRSCLCIVYRKVINNFYWWGKWMDGGWTPITRGKSGGYLKMRMVWIRSHTVWARIAFADKFTNFTPKLEALTGVKNLLLINIYFREVTRFWLNFQIIVIDWDKEAITSSRNQLTLARWDGSMNDQTLIELAMMLRSKFIISSKEEELKKIFSDENEASARIFLFS